MNVLAYDPGRRRKGSALIEQKLRDAAVARAAFRRGLVLGYDLAAQGRRGPVLIMPAEVSAARRPRLRFSIRAYVVVLMAALAAFLVFVLGV